MLLAVSQCRKYVGKLNFDLRLISVSKHIRVENNECYTYLMTDMEICLQEYNVDKTTI